MSGKIKFKNYCVFMREDGIVQVDLYDNAVIEVSDAKKIVEAEGIVGNGKKYPTLHIVGSFVTLGQGVQDYSAREGTAYTSAEAYVVPSLGHAIIGNFYLKINKPIVPTKIFKKEADAVAWLLEYVGK